MAKLVRVSLTPLEADLVHWSLIVLREYVGFGTDVPEPASFFSHSRNYQVVIDKVIKAKRRVCL